ncbi:MAG: ATP-dependent helicase/nuclease subunit B [Parvicella sp.]|jgi:ATP-dependent helicase/nuclease subunit B
MIENSFVAEVCDLLFENHKIENLCDVTLVIPSQRVGLHLKKELASRLLGSAFLPKIETIDVFLSKSYDLVTIDSIRAKFELYQCYSTLVKEKETFDSFQSWAGQILSDFGDVDKYLLDQKLVFSNLKDIKEIESWSFNQEELSPAQLKFLAFWEMLGDLYHSFNKHLQEKGYSTTSRMYRYFAENITDLIQVCKNDQLYFIGFNALSASEEQIMKSLTNAKIATMCWDCDGYYMEDKKQEAGQFIRQYQHWSGLMKKDLPNHLLDSQKSIKVYPSKTNIDQVNIVSKILSENPDFSASKSALVLGDELLLKPVLNVLPLHIEKMNIAMGYPLNGTFAFALLNQVFSVLKNVERYRSKKYFYYKDFEAFFTHECISSFIIANEVDLDPIFNKIKKENFTYIPKDIIEIALGDSYAVFSFLFYEVTSSVSEVLDSVITLFEKIRTHYIQNQNDVIEAEALTKICTSLDKARILIGNYPYIQTLEGLTILTKSIFSKEKISFYGEPLSGLQVLGLLETRGLDFENVILVSCNEDIIPKASFVDSLMPFDLRGYYGLPSKSDKEAMYAYYFYRLIQRAKNVHLVYNNGVSEKLNSNEVSRYILQLEKEFMPIVGKELEVVNYSFPQEQIEFKTGALKDESVVLRIREFLKMGVSASSLNAYRNCPLDFYYKYLTRLADKSVVEENIESSTYGSIVHEALEVLYKVEGKMISEKSIDNMLSRYLTVLDDCFLKVFPSGNFKEGKNLLLYKMADTSVQSLLKNEKKLIKENGVIEIIGLEQNYEVEIDLDTKFGVVPIKIKGNIDRIDKVGSSIRIIDYKTGRVEQKDVKINKDIGKSHDKPFQLMFYAYLFALSTNEDVFESGIISMRNLGAGCISLLNPNNSTFSEITDDFKAEFKGALEDLIEDLLDDAKDMKHNSKALYCDMC